MTNPITSALADLGVDLGCVLTHPDEQDQTLREWVEFASNRLIQEGLGETNQVRLTVFPALVFLHTCPSLPFMAAPLPRNLFSGTAMATFTLSDGGSLTRIDSEPDPWQKSMFRRLREERAARK